MLIAVVPVNSCKSTKNQIDKIDENVDGIELRLDYLNPLDFSSIAALRFACKRPVIFTLRKTSQGGFYQKNEEIRLQEISRLCKYHPDYFDIEYDVPTTFVKEMMSRYPTIKWIRSFHDFDHTPSDLDKLFDSLKETGFYSYKIATKANTILDTFRMLEFVKSRHTTHKITGLCMGEKGQITRILSPIIGNAMNYTVLDATQLTAPGQLTLNQLLTTYHYKKLNLQTKLYALLGDPVHMSVGHILHNQAIEYLQENAVYIKIPVTANELPFILEKCKNLSFFGFSITMPLKEAVIPSLDKIENPSIKAINSIIKYQDAFIGFNTDGIGAIQALMSYTDITQKTFIILGAGGAAKAIAYEALRHKAHVIILNRTLGKAKILSTEIGCESNELKTLPHLKTANSIIINTLPNHVYSEYPALEWINFNSPSHFIAMDIVYQPIETTFLKLAKQANAVYIFGYEMYIHQALLQIKQWFKPTDQQLHDIKNKMKQFFQHQLNNINRAC
ncbi:MAG: type I 3-dehydroquinate dehydratase [Gammaproteobacteria bacterium]|nr:type I 3-dehydroquinate dehydratase [Gammaproteobacteria bacterium]